MQGRESVPERTGGRRFPVPFLVVAAVLLVVLMVFLGRFCSTAATIEVTVNGTPLSLHGAKTLDTAIRESGLPINPGDLISLDGMVLKRSAGNPFFATVNGEETLDRERALANGDEVYLTDGTDIVEDYDVEEEVIPCGTMVLGLGALCTFEYGTPKVVEHLTGQLSGAQVDRVTQQEEKNVAQWHVPDVGSDKVLALTFDCGPSEDYTGRILDVLSEYDAKATFFCKGENVQENPDLVRREIDEGHQVASNTYSRDVSEGTALEQVVSEVQKGFQAIDEALGSAQGRRVVRFPGALLTTAMASVVIDEADAVVGWDLDTGDWMASDATAVYDELMEAEPGEIVVMHDGDYDCSVTIAGLRRALPKLKERGYTFVTIDELLEYPAKDES